ncbi:MAG TPA: hypothetical protein VJJ82_00480 [Candidatus Nanoarchaeia archaeon]|nr:hypothetical protein [Candidatus Nanoarchaeia archaeon]
MAFRSIIIGLFAIVALVVIFAVILRSPAFGNAVYFESPTLESMSKSFEQPSTEFLEKDSVNVQDAEKEEFEKEPDLTEVGGISSCIPTSENKCGSEAVDADKSVALAQARKNFDKLFEDYTCESPACPRKVPRATTENCEQQSNKVYVCTVCKMIECAP